MHKLPYVTEHYELVVGEDADGKACYHVRSLQHGVTEYEDYIYPRSVEALHNLEIRWKEVSEAIKDKEEAAFAKEDKEPAKIVPMFPRKEIEDERSLD